MDVGTAGWPVGGRAGDNPGGTVGWNKAGWECAMGPVGNPCGSMVGEGCGTGDMPVGSSAEVCGCADTADGSSADDTADGMDVDNEPGNVGGSPVGIMDDMPGKSPGVNPADATAGTLSCAGDADTIPSMGGTAGAPGSNG